MKAALAMFLLFALFVGNNSASAQTESLLHSFNTADGGWPLSNLIVDAGTGAFYGTTSIGGASNNGTVFKLQQDASGGWTENVLYSFQGSQNGDCSSPNSGLTATYSSNGSLAVLYGTCDFGGQNNYGAVFALAPQPDGSLTEKIVYSFQSITDGADPRGGVVLDQQRNLYGTTNIGGANLGGTVYQLTPSETGWTKTVLYNFNSPANPEGRLLLGTDGALYGTTTSDGPSFSGTVFQLIPPGTQTQNWTYNLLYTFSGNTGDGDGANPRGGLITDKRGAMYGTTESGGIAGLGTVFKLLAPNSHNNAWREEQLYKFSAVSDGAGPVAGLTFGKSGDLYGTTSAGGAFFGGTVFRLHKRAKIMLWAFGASGDGSAPWTSLLRYQDKLYGTTIFGGAFSDGTVYEIASRP